MNASEAEQVVRETMELTVYSKCATPALTPLRKTRRPAWSLACRKKQSFVARFTRLCPWMQFLAHS